MDDLNHFCVVSCQKVSSRNPVIFFSLDVGINVANEISRLSSTPLTTNLGRYFFFLDNEGVRVSLRASRLIPRVP